MKKQKVAVKVKDLKARKNAKGGIVGFTTTDSSGFYSYVPVEELSKLTGKMKQPGKTKEGPFGTSSSTIK